MVPGLNQLPAFLPFLTKEILQPFNASWKDIVDKTETILITFNRRLLLWRLPLRQFMNCRTGNLQNRNLRLNATRTVSVLSTMSFREALNGWRISFVRKGRKAGSWFNPDTTTRNFSVYGRRRKKPGRKAEAIYPLSN